MRVNQLLFKNGEETEVDPGNKFLPQAHFELPVDQETNIIRVFFKVQINMDSKNTNAGLITFSADEKPA